MIDPGTYERYSIPLEQKMFELEGLLRDFLRAVESCSQSANQQFIREAREIGSELAGRPGDAALEVYNDLERDLSNTSSFVQRWAMAGTGATAPAFQAAARVRDGLQELHGLVQSTPSDVMDEIKSRIRSQRGDVTRVETPRTRIRRRGFRVGFFVFGMIAFFVVSYTVGISPTTLTFQDLWAERGISGLAVILLPSILAALLGGVLGSEVAWRAFLRQSSIDRGWRDIETSKELWQLDPDLAPAEWYGRINPKAMTYQESPRICKAKTLLRNAAEHAPASNRDTIQAKVNEAIAVRELGLLHRAVNEFEEAQESYSRSLHILKSLGGMTSTRREVLSAYRETVFRLGELSHALKDYRTAEESYRESLHVDDILGHDDPSGEHYARALLQEVQNRT